MVGYRSSKRVIGLIFLVTAMVPVAYGADSRPVTGASFSPPVELTHSHPYNQFLWETRVSGEPVVELGPDGTIYVSGAAGVGTASPVWYSRDGQTFSELETPAHAREWTIGAEGDIAIDDEGRVYFVDTYVGGLVLTRWSSPTQWDFTVPIAGLEPVLQDRPWMTWSDGKLVLYVNHGDEVHLYSSPDGLVWTDEGPLTWKGGATGQPYFPGHMSAQRAGDGVVVGGMVRDFKRERIFLAASYRSQGRWREQMIRTWPRKGGISAIFPGITTIDDRGRAFITWSEYGWSGNCRVYYSYTEDAGRRWSNPIGVSRGGCATFPWITSAGDEVALAWYQTPERGNPAGTEAARRAFMAGFPAAALGSQDEVPTSAPWYVHVAHITGAASGSPSIRASRVASTGPIFYGPLERWLWDFFEVELTEDGRVHIVFTEDRGRDGSSSWYVTGTFGAEPRSHTAKER